MQYPQRDQVEDCQKEEGRVHQICDRLHNKLISFYFFECVVLLAPRYGDETGSLTERKGDFFVSFIYFQKSVNEICYPKSFRNNHVTRKREGEREELHLENEDMTREGKRKEEKS